MKMNMVSVADPAFNDSTEVFGVFGDNKYVSMRSALFAAIPDICICRSVVNS